MSANKMTDGSSRWYASFYVKDHFGKTTRKKKEGFRTKKEAVKYEDDFKKKHSGACDMTFRAMNELYLASAAVRVKDSTLRKKKFILEGKILPTFGDIPVCEITPLMIHDWQTEMMKHDWKGTYLRTINNDLASVFSFAEQYHGLKENPCAKERRMGKKDADAMQFWTLAEYRQAAAVIKNPQVKLIFELLFWTGLRRGEAMALTPNDFDFAAKTVRVTKTTYRYHGENVTTSPKTEGSRRVVTMPEHLCRAVQDYIAHMYKPQPNEMLFYRNPSSLDNDIKKIAALADVKRIRVHDLRHSHASMLIEQGFSPLLIAERLGHESVDTTLRIYSHLYPNKQADVAARLNEIQNN